MSLRRALFTTDHRTVGAQYFFLALAAALTGILLSLLMRVHVVWPQAAIPFLGAIKPENYLAMMTMHATFMVFFVLTTAPQNAFGTALLPLQIGAREMAWPMASALSFWGTLLSFLVMLAAFFVEGGAPISGWTHYAPMSALPEATPEVGRGMDLWLVSIGIFCCALMLNAVNVIVTTIRHRAPGMTWMRLPLTVWAWFVTALLILSAFSVLLAAAIMLLLDRSGHTAFFIPAGLAVSGKQVLRQGGEPLLWQHLFWFFGHPEVYIAILPGMGLVSQLLANFSRKPIFGYRVMVVAICAIGVLGLGVWGHHMFVSGMSLHGALFFANMTMAVGVPSAVKTLNWLATMWRGRIRLETPMLFAIGFVSLFITGGLTGPLLAQPTLDSYLHDTYFVVAHFHLIMGMAATFGIFAATYYWFPAIFGCRMHEGLGRWHFILTFIGAYLTFLPMHLLGMAGHPRRYSQLTEVHYLQALLPLQKFISFAAFFTMAAQLLFLANLFLSLRRRQPVDANPWQATTLEWRDLDQQLPVTVQHGPCEYSVPGAPRDYVMQSDPA